MNVSKQQEDLIISLNKKGKSAEQISAIIGIDKPMVEGVIAAGAVTKVIKKTKKVKSSNTLIEKTVNGLVDDMGDTL